MSTNLFNTQLVAQQFSSGKDLGSITGGTGSKSLRHNQRHDGLESNDRGFLKTLERLSVKQQPSQPPKPSDRNEMPVAEDSSLNSGGNNGISDSRDPAHNFIGANSHIAADNKVVVGGLNIDPAHINLLDLLKQLGIEFLATDGQGRIDESAVQGENAKSGATLEHPTPDSTKFSSIDLAKLETLLLHLQADNNPRLSHENRHFVQLIRTLSGNETLNSTKDLGSQHLLQDTSGKSQQFQAVAENLKEALKNIHETQPVNEKPTVADLLRKISPQLSQPGTPSQNWVSAASKTNIPGDTTEGDKTLLTRLDAGLTSKDMMGGKNFKTQDLTEVIRPSSDPSKAPAPGIVQNVQKQIPNSDLHGNPAAKNESMPFVFNPPSHVNHGNTEQTGKMTNLNPIPVSADKVVVQVLTAESDVKDGGLLFNQSQNEVKTPETKLVTPETKMLQKDFRSQTVNQIVQKAVLHLNGGQHEVRLDLKPDFLGHIRMQIITESQLVTVRILTEYPMVKELIENNLQQLKSELQNHGLEIDELDVSVEDDADQHVADRKMAAQAKTKPSTETGEQSQDSRSNDTKANRVGPNRNEGDTRVDFFA
jgi:flagellar hook-length control protein FliK